MRKLVLSSLFSLLTITLFSQIEYILNDYIIDNKGDTLFGEVYQTKSKFHIKFVDKSGKKQTFRADKLKGFKKGVKEFKVKRVDNIPVYLRVVVDGPVILYETYDHLIEPSSLYIIEKDGELIQFNYIFVKRNLSEFFSDYKELTNFIRNDRFDYENLAEAVTVYNSWLLNNKGNVKISPSRPLESRKVNHKYIQGDKINLYHETYVKPSPSGINDQITNVYVEKRSDMKPIKLKNKKLVTIFKDHQIIYDKIISGYYDLRDIETIVYIYNTTD